jgi:hypothetical protein
MDSYLLAAVLGALLCLAAVYAIHKTKDDDS